MKGKGDESQFLAFIWGGIFAGGLFAFIQGILFYMAWGDPPSIVDLIGTLAFFGLAIILLTPAILVLIEILQGRFAALVEEARSEADRP